ncbi:MAG: hypothetical protein LC799_32785, partial [Actinobacteria bacterium]|nr:hypothetical protein [Actinomycetota bacterium]
MTAPTTSGVPPKTLRTRVIETLARQRTPADIGVALLVPASAAIFGLVLEDAFPVGTNPQTFSGIRWGIMIGLLGLLIAAVAYRRWVYHGTGTLYSLSFLAETMIDYHEQAQADAARRHMAVQLLSRRVDIMGRERDGVADVVQPRQDLSRALESAMNQDREDTGYAVAPNLLWPAALAVGASLTRTDRMRFLDYDKTTTTEFRLRDKSAERVAVRTKPDHVVPRPTGHRRGALLSFTPAAAKFDIDRRCAEFGISDLVLVGQHSQVQGHLLSGSEMGRLADDLAGHLADIKRTTGDRELVVVAFLPKTVALLTGWYLSRQKVRFFAGTHLMHYLPSEDRFVALRVHPSQ